METDSGTVLGKGAVALLFAAGLTLAATQPASAQDDFSVDPELADRGQQLWFRTGCEGCHTLGRGRSAGPDLVGITQRRQIDWLEAFLADTDSMLDYDPLAQRMLEIYNWQRMPEIRLNQSEITALIHYMAEETQEEEESR